MRLQLVGSYTLEEFQDAISKIIKDLKSNKINSIRNVNIYLKTCVDGREIRLADNGVDVEHLILDYGHRQQLSMLSSELSVVTAHKMKPSGAEEE